GITNALAVFFRAIIKILREYYLHDAALFIDNVYLRGAKHDANISFIPKLLKIRRFVLKYI
ncbi:hypothetical protein BU23DRAFT_471794, partial [Bimuria novae-zelandiae CBS 107.79]